MNYLSDFTEILVDAGEGELLPPRSSNKNSKRVNLTRVEFNYPKSPTKYNYYT